MLSTFLSNHSSSLLSKIIASLSPEMFDYATLTCVTVVAFAIDFFFCGRKQSTSVKSSIFWTIFWLVAAFAYSVFILTMHGPAQTDEFIAGYVLERILSADNIFVFVMIISYFKVPAELQQRVLFMGIVISLFLRGVFILIGGILVVKFTWTMYIFGAFLLFTGAKLLFASEGEDETENLDSNMLVRLLKKFLNFIPNYHGNKLCVRDGGKTLFTMLFLVIVVIAVSNVIFAVDSIPAIFAITTNNHIVFAANIFSMLGLRSIFFIIESAIRKFTHMKYALSAILMFIGLKMLIEHFVKISTEFSLFVIVFCILFAIITSFARSITKPKMKY